MDFDKLKNKLETVYSELNDYVSEKLHFEYTNDKYKLLEKLNDELGYVSLSKDEYKKMVDKYDNLKKEMDSEVENKITDKTRELQSELTHRVEKHELEQKLNVVKLEETIRHLELEKKMLNDRLKEKEKEQPRQQPQQPPQPQPVQSRRSSKGVGTERQSSRGEKRDKEYVSYNGKDEASS